MEVVDVEDVGGGEGEEEGGGRGGAGEEVGERGGGGGEEVRGSWLSVKKV